jgi:hypothetical protein
MLGRHNRRAAASGKAQYNLNSGAFDNSFKGVVKMGRPSVKRSGSNRRPTQSRLSNLRKRDPRAKSYIAFMGPELFWVLKDGRQAYLNGDLESLLSERLHYVEIRGEDGLPPSIDEYFRQEETREGNLLERQAVADIFEWCLKQSGSALKIDTDTILRYMREADKQAYEVRAEQKPPVVSLSEFTFLVGREHIGDYQIVSYKQI